MDDQENKHEFLEDHGQPSEEEETCPTLPSNRSDSMEGKSAKNLLLRIKLKVSKSKECDEEGLDYNQSSEKENRRLDTDCKRKPKLKIHHQKLVYPSVSNRNHNATDEPNSISNANNNNNNTNSCSECGKTFPSLKSLSGHLRKHPEREWRGIQPPTTAKNTPSSSSTVSDSIGQKVRDRIDSPTTTGSSALDLLQFLPSWRVTARRGRKSISSANSEEEQEQEQEVPDAVYNLLMLAQSQSLESALSNKESEGTHSELLSKKASIEGTDNCLENLNESKKKRRIIHESESGNKDFMPKKLQNDETGFDSEAMMNMDSGEDSKQNSEEEANSGKHFTLTCEMRKKKKKKKTIKLKDLETVEDYKQSYKSPDRYKCTTCNKGFPTHQALGGHKSSHNKGKKSLQTTNMEENALGAEQYLDDHSEFNEMGSSKVVCTHRCQICNMTFPTGQALGGHMGRHRNDHVEAHTSSSVVSQEEVHKMGHGLDIDLNEMPVMEEEEEKEEEGFESASTHQSIGIKQPVDHASLY